MIPCVVRTLPIQYEHKDTWITYETIPWFKFLELTNNVNSIDSGSLVAVKKVWTFKKMKNKNKNKQKKKKKRQKQHNTTQNKNIVHIKLLWIFLRTTIIWNWYKVLLYSRSRSHITQICLNLVLSHVLPTCYKMFCWSLQIYFLNTNRIRDRSQILVRGAWCKKGGP